MHRKGAVNRKKGRVSLKTHGLLQRFLFAALYHSLGLIFRLINPPTIHLHISFPKYSHTVIAHTFYTYLVVPYPSFLS